MFFGASLGSIMSPNLEVEIKESPENVDERETNDEDKRNGCEIQGDEVKKKINKFTLKQKIALVMLATVDLLSFCSMSIMAPFYPQEAAKKGMTESTAGIVFGFYALVVFLTCPLIGKIMPKMGVKTVFIVGIVLCGICSVAFGTLNFVNDYTTFTTLSFIIRGLEALGAGAFSTAVYVLIVNIFPENAGAVRGLLETFVGLGLSLGPAIGGILFTIGGFGLPFYVMGVITIITAPLNYYLLPPSNDCNMETKSGSLVSLLKIPCVIVTCCIMIVTAMTWTYLDPTLEPHLRKYKLSPSIIGLIFLLESATYGIFSPIWGWITDKTTRYHWLMSIGLILSCGCLLLLGPSSILSSLEESVWLDVVALAFLGICIAMTLIPSYQSILDSALKEGFLDNTGTHSVIAGLWSSVYSLGEVLGPVLGGYLMEEISFSVTSTVFAILNLVMGILAMIYFAYRKPYEDSVKEKEQVKMEARKTNLGDVIILHPKHISNGLMVLSDAKN